LTLTPPDRFTLSVIQRTLVQFTFRMGVFALLTALVTAGLEAQVSIGGTLGFTANKTSGNLTSSSNTTTNTSAGTFGNSTLGGLTVSGAIARTSLTTAPTAWTKDATSSSYAVQTVTLKNGNDTATQTGTFTLTFLPDGSTGSALNLATFAFTIDPQSGGNTDTYSWSMNSATSSATYTNIFGGSVSNDNFSKQYYSSFVYNTTQVFYRVFGNTATATNLAENASASQYVGFQITNIQPIPEPGTYALAGPLVLFGAMGVRKLRRKAKVPAPAG
jgi:hypothetical protein